MKHVVALLLSIAATLLLGACGQKGPLFLPGHAPESQTDGAFDLDANDGDEPREDGEPGRQVPDIH